MSRRMLASAQFHAQHPQQLSAVALTIRTVVTSPGAVVLGMWGRGYDRIRSMRCSRGAQIEAPTPLRRSKSAQTTGCLAVLRLAQVGTDFGFEGVSAAGFARVFSPYDVGGSSTCAGAWRRQMVPKTYHGASS